ncbi:hypothetical protein PI124_g10800 [Phytophthora idaei]|nr:hypothetical protein PI125_g19376 [Phytophthora idaei]KAG3244414.1 hypothetical protein PI124_g10800 [Phytophthora idaei]
MTPTAVNNIQGLNLVGTAEIPVRVCLSESANDQTFNVNAQ